MIASLYQSTSRLSGKPPPPGPISAPLRSLSESPNLDFPQGSKTRGGKRPTNEIPAVFKIAQLRPGGWGTSGATRFPGGYLINRLGKGLGFTGCGSLGFVSGLGFRVPPTAKKVSPLMTENLRTGFVWEAFMRTAEAPWNGSEPDSTNTTDDSRDSRFWQISHPTNRKGGSFHPTVV